MWEICEASTPFADIPPASIPIAVVKENKRPKISRSLPDVSNLLVERQNIHILPYDYFHEVALKKINIAMLA
jgi:hypothetical protein